jgi:vancomycin permeability regulator SanA
MLARSLSIFIGLLAAAGVVARVSGASFDPTILWVDLRALPGWMGPSLLLMLVAAIGLDVAGRSRRWMAAVPLLFAVLSLGNAIGFYRFVWSGEVHSGAGVPFTLLVGIALGWMTVRTARGGRSVRVPRHTRGYLRRASFVGMLVVAWGGIFALGQMWCFGKTDYARPADAIVVFGARTYADGRLSAALEDRVRTGVELYEAGLAPRIIMSGGPGDGAIDEPTAMRDFAMSLGVPADAIEMDPDGWNTRGTIETLSHLPSRSRVLAVSHFYHLPRVKLAAHQAGVDVYTVPAHERVILRQLPRYMVRETAAFWAYLLGSR